MADEATYTAKRVLAKIRRAEQDGLQDTKTKMYRLRGICAGAKEFLSDSSPGLSSDAGSYLQDPTNLLRPDVLVTMYTEGKSNALLNLLIDLMLKVTLKFPDIYLEGVPAKRKTINTQYLKARLGPESKGGCDWMPETRIAVLDYLMGGLGCLYLPIMPDGKPGWRWADTLQLVWDQGVRTPNQVRWMAMKVSRPLWEWQDMFPDSMALKKLRPVQTIADMTSEERLDHDEMTSLLFYYDKDGDGHQFVFVCNGDNDYEDEPVFKGQNPHRMTVCGKDKPFLPFTTAFFAMLPSVRQPIGVAEKMLPDQIMIWRLIQLISDTIEKGSPFYLADQNAFADEKAKQAFLNSGDPGDVVFTDGNPEAVKVSPALPLPQTVIEELQRCLTSLRAQAGVSNAVTGQATPGAHGGKMTATEYQHVAAESQLTSASVQGDVTSLLEDGLCKFLWNGQKHDDAPFSCLVGEVLLEFGPKGKFQLGPVAEYLAPEAWITVDEDSMLHISKTQRIAQKEQVVEVALKVAGALASPAVSTAFREYLQAQGIDNWDAYLAPPQQPGQAPGQAQMGAQQSTGG